MQETDPLFRAASDQYKIMKKSLAKPSESMTAQGELSLSEKALLACMARLANRVKAVEEENRQLKTSLDSLKTKGQDE